MRRLPRAEIAEKVARALAMVRLEGLADRRTQQLSGGQQQRVAVARALVFEPRLVLLDEPLGALDRQLREQMQYELKHLHQRLGVTMVYVTHDQIEAMTMSDRVAVFSTGLLRQVAEPRRLYEEPDSLFVAQFLGESNALAATVERRDGGQCAATLPGGETIIATAVGACVAGGKVDLVLRPEKVALGAAAARLRQSLPGARRRGDVPGRSAARAAGGAGPRRLRAEAAQRGRTRRARAGRRGRDRLADGGLPCPRRLSEGRAHAVQVRRPPTG